MGGNRAASEAAPVARLGAGVAGGAWPVLEDAVWAGACPGCPGCPEVLLEKAGAPNDEAPKGLLEPGRCCA